MQISGINGSQFPRFAGLSIKVMEVPGLPKDLRANDMPGFMHRYNQAHKAGKAVANGTPLPRQDAAFPVLAAYQASKANRDDVFSMGRFGTPVDNRVIFVSLTTSRNSKRFRQGDGDIVVKHVQPDGKTTVYSSPEDLSCGELARLTEAFRFRLNEVHRANSIGDGPIPEWVGKDEPPSDELGFQNRIAATIRLSPEFKHALAELPDPAWELLNTTLGQPNDLRELRRLLSKIAEKRLRAQLQAHKY